jgi:hypothetical protein
VDLKHCPLNVIELSGQNTEEFDEPLIMASYGGIISKDIKVKIEMKEEDGEMSDHIEAEFVNDHG